MREVSVWTVNIFKQVQGKTLLVIIPSHCFTIILMIDQILIDKHAF